MLLALIFTIHYGKHILIQLCKQHVPDSTPLLIIIYYSQTQDTVNPGYKTTFRNRHFQHQMRGGLLQGIQLANLLY